MPREAAEEAKEAIAAPTAAAAGGGDGLDMFADNVDADMFAEDPGAPVGIAPAKKALLDNYDDVEGYYNFQVAVCAASLCWVALVCNTKCTGFAANRRCFDACSHSEMTEIDRHNSQAEVGKIGSKQV